jgi:hypothetical protein
MKPKGRIKKQSKSNIKMKRISIICSLFCLIAFTQCNKDEPISEIIAQEEENYGNLEKIETLWEEGDEKIVTLWEEGCGKELYEEFLDLEERAPKMRRLGTNYPGDYMAAVIRLGPNCGNNPRVEFYMDCEDSGNNSHIRNWDYDKNMATGEGVIVSWLTNYGIIKSTKGDITMNLCLLLDVNNFPKGRISADATWAIITTSGTIYSSSSGPLFSKYISRFIDNEDSNNTSYGDYYEPNSSTPIRMNSKDNTKPYLNGLRQPVGSHKDSYITFAIMENWATGLNSFPDLGFSYAVFSKKPASDGAFVAEVRSDDEDKNNINAWEDPRGSVGMRVSRDYGFIQGSKDTYFYVTKAK